MKKGWIVGDFLPNVIQYKEGEIAVKRMKKGRVVDFFCDHTYKYLFVILSGQCYINGELVLSNQIIIADQIEKLTINTFEEIIYLQIRIRYDKKESSLSEQLDNLLKWQRFFFEHSDFNPSNTPINFSDISVVVQGAIDKKVTKLCTASIRRFLPGCSIILSTWEGQETRDIDCDCLIENEDPGSKENGVIKPFDVNFNNNVNRQLISTSNGLKRVRTKYALKMRSDMIITTNEFLKYFERYPCSTNELKLFEHKVMVSDMYTKVKHGSVDNSEEQFFPTPFHVSDFFFFGEVNDLKKYFLKTKVMRKEKMGSFQDLVYPERKEKYKCVWNYQFGPEQFLAISALRENGFNIEMRDWTDWSDEYIEMSRKFIMNNFIILNYCNNGFYLPKYKGAVLGNSGKWEYRLKGLFTQKYFEQTYNEMF